MATTTDPLMVLPAAVTATATVTVDSGQPQHTPPGSDSEVAAGDAEMGVEFAEDEAELAGMREQRRQRKRARTTGLASAITGINYQYGRPV
jgi:hypothetical protein